MTASLCPANLDTCPVREAVADSASTHIANILRELKAAGEVSRERQRQRDAALTLLRDIELMAPAIGADATLASRMPHIRQLLQEPKP
jgi:hypothetical protein